MLLWVLKDSVEIATLDLIVWGKPSLLLYITIVALLTLKHISVGIVGYSKDVRWHLCPSLSFEHANYLFSIYW